MSAAKAAAKPKRVKKENHLKLIKTKTKNPELARKRQKQIYRGALKVFRSKGFHAASIREIAEACQISLGSLYDYIEKKEDILFLVHNEIMDQIYSRLNGCLEKYSDPTVNFSEILREIFSLNSQLHDEVQFIYSETKSLAKDYQKKILQRESEYVADIEAIIKKGVKKGVFSCQEPKIVANIITYLAAIMPLRGWNLLPGFGAEEVYEEIIQMVLNRLGVYQK